MFMRRVFLFCAVLLSVVAVVPNADAAAKKYRVVMSWTEADSIGQMIMTKHAANMLDDLGQDNVQLEILAYGPATLAVRKSGPQTLYADAIQKLTERGVVFHVCSHAMDFFGVKKDEVLPTVAPVPGAMSYLLQMHAAGWQILKP
jgi:hypothetical protein